MSSAEYFIDADPGAGSGTTLSVGASGNTANFTAPIPTASLSNGFHILAIRTRDADGIWSLFETRAFYISSSTTDAADITAAEFFMNADPGPGNGTSMNIGASGNTVNFSSALPTASLPKGFHTLAIRTKNSAGQWSLFETRSFYITASAADMPMISQAEYFIDADPGVGNGSPLTVNAPGNTINQTFMAVVPPGTATGQHLLAIRTRDANGNWSLFETADFTVGGVLPLSWTSFTGERAATVIRLKWTTENEVSTSHFIVERSRNGIDFSPIGNVSALGGPHNSYGFDDAHPMDGVNFYRLKQVDQNGDFKYASIVKVYWETGINTLKLYPNPVLSALTAEFSGRGKDAFVEIYDVSGKMIRNLTMSNQHILSIPVAALAGGKYWIVISDGVVRQTGSFIKQ